MNFAHIASKMDHSLPPPLPASARRSSIFADLLTVFRRRSIYHAPLPSTSTTSEKYFAESENKTRDFEISEKLDLRKENYRFKT